MASWKTGGGLFQGESGKLIPNAAERSSRSGQPWGLIIEKKVQTLRAGEWNNMVAPGEHRVGGWVWVLLGRSHRRGKGYRCKGGDTASEGAWGGGKERVYSSGTI